MSSNKEDYLLDAWSDVKPICSPQNSSLPMYVEYSPLYKLMMGLFRAIMESEEKSERSKNLVNMVIKAQNSNYTVWWYRRKILQHIGFSAESEAQYVINLLGKTLKPYQLWYQLKWVLSSIAEPLDIIPDIMTILEKDTKNFHAWSFLRWFSQKFSKKAEVLSVTSSMLEIDPYNNSAWSLRFSIVSASDLNLTQEIDYAISVLKDCIDNNSAANFLIGLSKHNQAISEQIRQKACLLLDDKPNEFLLLSLLYFASQGCGRESNSEELKERIFKAGKRGTSLWASDRFKLPNQAR